MRFGDEACKLACILAIEHSMHPLIVDKLYHVFVVPEAIYDALSVVKASLPLCYGCT